MNIKKISTPLISVGLVCTTIIFYFSSLFYDFQFDDNLAILKQFAIRQANFISLFFSSTRWVGEWVNSINFTIGKFNPFIFRSTNLIIHLATTLLVFWLLLQLLSTNKKQSFFSMYRVAIAGISALFFALHPLQTQTVCYIIQGRLEGLSAFFVLATLISFIYATRAQKKWHSLMLFILMFCFAFLAYGSKEISVITPVLIILIDWFFIAQGSWTAIKKRLPLYALFFAFTVGVYAYLKKKFLYDVLTFNTQIYNNVGNILTNSVADTIKPFPFLISQFKVIVHYLWIFVWPWAMSVEYDWKLCSGILAPDCLIPLLVLILVGGGIMFLLKRNKTNLLAFGLLWFFICIAPRSSIIPSGELLADYKTYLASLGIFFLFASGMVYLLKKYRLMKWQFLFVVILTFILGLATWQRATVWRSDIDFWADILKKAPFKARAHNNYAIALLKQHKYQEAIYYLKQALQLQQGNYWDPYTNLSIAYANLGNIDEAIKSIKHALRINPRHPESFNSLGLLFQQQAKLDDAIKAFQVATVLRPHYGKAYFNLGQTYLMQESLEKAWQAFKDCCIDGDYDTVTDGFERYAAVSMHLEKFDDAIIGYQKILTLDPSFPDARMNLANAHYFKGDYQQALDIYLQANTENPQDFRPLSNVAQVYLKLNMPETALEYFQKAREFPDAPLELELKIARCFDHMGQKDMARALLKKLAHQKEDTRVAQKAKELLK